MLLSALLKDIYKGDLESRFLKYNVRGISCDSREDQPEGVFVAISGFKFDGNDFIKDAVARGAHVIVKKGHERILKNFTIPDHVCVLNVDDPKAFLQKIALRFYDEPSKAVQCLGVTGTNGKTTVTYLLESIVHASHKRCGVMGTINYRVGQRIFSSKNTTPGLIEIQRFLNDLRQERVEYCVMEVSSHALEQGRVAGIDFKCGIFTNLTQDHLDYHKTMQEYFKAKSLLFTGLNEQAWAVINIDDPYGQQLVGLSKGKKLTYAIDHSADIQAKHISYGLNGSEFEIQYPNGKTSIRTQFIGRHNVYNILAAFGCAYSQGIAIETIVEGIQALTHVPGRLEPVSTGKDFFVFIDYAHTDDGLINVLKALRAVSQNRIIVVFGCGGDRDRGKRPKMGKAAGELADHCIVTSDNPRSEDPQSIINDICAGFSGSNFEVCIDRKEAIGKALRQAKAGEIVLLAGKGHEDYQILKDRTIKFDEREVVQELLK